MKRKVKYIVIGLIVLLIVLYFYLMSLPTIEGSLTRIDILRGTYRSPDSIRRYGDVDYDLTPAQIEAFLKNPEDYLILQYIFNLKNQSAWKKIYNIKLRPTFPDKMKKIVFAYRKKRGDGLGAPIFIDTNNSNAGVKRIIIKRQVIDKDFLKLIMEVKFEALGQVGFTTRVPEFVIIGSCSAMLDSSQDIAIEDQTKEKED